MHGFVDVRLSQFVLSTLLLLLHRLLTKQHGPWRTTLRFVFNTCTIPGIGAIHATAAELLIHVNAMAVLPLRGHELPSAPDATECQIVTRLNLYVWSVPTCAQSQQGHFLHLPEFGVW